MHKGEIFDIRQVSGIRPNSDLQIRKLVTERVAPRPGVADMFVEINDEQRRGWNGAQQSLRGDVQVRSDQRTGRLRANRTTGPALPAGSKVALSLPRTPHG